jgi:hypothetical protein
MRSLPESGRIGGHDHPEAHQAARGVAATRSRLLIVIAWDLCVVATTLRLHLPDSVRCRLADSTPVSLTTRWCV